MRILIVALVALLLVPVGPAFGGALELGVYGGFGWLDDYGFFHPDDDNILGARLGYWFNPKWSLEFSAQKLDTDTEFDILGLGPDREFKTKAARLNLIYAFSGHGFTPFLTGGLGKEKVKVEDFGESCDIGWNAGGGFRIPLGSTLLLRLDGRYSRVKVGDEIDDSQGNVEATAGLSLMFGGHHHEAEAVSIEAPPNQPPTVTCAVDRAEVLPGEAVNVTVTATDPEGGPLTYEWVASSGRVTGSGATASFDFTGVTPPSTSTVTVRVTDDHGNSASSDCSVRLLEPQRKAEAVSCIAGGFPRNLSRLNNVDKACLDDVAQRLVADPRARVIVIGHADSHEKGSNALSEKRAGAVRDYLVTGRSIDTARITVRSVGSTKMVATGSDEASMQNRRVEVWFVPEGATGPE